MQRKKVLFVGSFIEKAKDGSVGGQMFASKSLVNSSLAYTVDWILLDTTGKSVPPPPVYIRMLYAFIRLVKFLWLLILKRPDSTLLFTGSAISMYEKGTMALIASFTGTRVILAPRGGPLDKEIQQSRILEKFVRLVLQRTEVVVCQGGYWKRFFSSLLPIEQAEKSVVIPNWIDADKYPLSMGRTNPEEPLHVLYMGWIQEDKGILDLYHAIKALPVTGERVNFYFLGDGPLRQPLMSETSNRDGRFRFFFPGWVYGQEKMDYLARADVFVLASHSEGLPNSLMEAMVCGVASIATNVGAVADLIIPGKTGMLIEKQDVSALTDSLALLLGNADLRTLYANEGRKQILANHSIHSAVERFRMVL